MVAWANGQFLDYSTCFSLKIDNLPHKLMKFIRKIEKNTSKNTAGVISVSAVFAVWVGRLSD